MRLVRLGLLVGALSFSAALADSPYSCTWTFQDGEPASSSTCSPPPVRFSTPGKKRVTLTICGRTCSTVSKLVEVRSPKPAIRSLTASPRPLYVGDVLQATADVSGSPPLSYRWTLPDRSSSTAAAPAFSTSLLRPGFYPLSLTLSSPLGSTTRSTSISLLDPKPRVTSLLLSPNPAPIGATVRGTAAATGRPPLSFHWTLDGLETPLSSSSGMSWSTSGLAPATRTVTLTVSNTYGSTSVRRQIRLLSPLISDFRVAGCPPACTFPVGSSVPFTLTLSGRASLYSYDWNGDGRYEKLSTVPITTYTYSAPGTYSARVLVAGGGLQETRTIAAPIQIIR